MKQGKVAPAEGKLGIMVVGCGAVATTFMTGVLMARKGLAKPIGAMTQYDKIRVGKGNNKKYLHYKDIVPIADMNDIVFGTWDVYPQNAYQAAVYAEVLKAKDIEPVRSELEAIKPLKAAFDKNYAKRIDGDNVKKKPYTLANGRGTTQRYKKLQTGNRSEPRSGTMGCIYRDICAIRRRLPQHVREVRNSNESRRLRTHFSINVLCTCSTNRRLSIYNGSTKHHCRYSGNVAIG